MRTILRMGDTIIILGRDSLAERYLCNLNHVSRSKPRPGLMARSLEVFIMLAGAAGFVFLCLSPIL